MQAASLLGDAKCRSIAWNGTSASWLGFDTDRALCRAISDATGAATCTSVLALNEILSVTGVTRIALVTPYLPDVQARIIANYASIGVTVVAERHFSLQDNFSFSDVTEATIEAAIRDVADARPEAIVILCTNLRGATLADRLEAELGIPIYDSVSTALWKSLLLCGEDPSRITGFGRIFVVPGL
jgi:maleate isomerase